MVTLATKLHTVGSNRKLETTPWAEQHQDSLLVEAALSQNLLIQANEQLHLLKIGGRL